MIQGSWAVITVMVLGLGVAACDTDDKPTGLDTAVGIDPDTDTDTDADTDADTDTDTDADTDADTDTDSDADTDTGETGDTSVYPGAQPRVADEGWRPLFWQLNAQPKADEGILR